MEAFGRLRTAVEKVGVYVLLIGNLGNYRTDLSPEVFRGFSIASPVAPFIVINDTDSKSAWSFTLLHELAHVFLGDSDISGYGSDNNLERLCDDAASMFLLPPGEIEGLLVDTNTDVRTAANLIGQFSRARKISRKMVAYNLLRSGRIDSALYRRLDARFDEDRLDFERQRESEGGPDYYVVRRHRAGSSLIRTVDRMVSSGALTTPKAARVLGVKPTAVDRLTRGVASA
jgi:Zn-dependent peptidase ImmA (M78 family)